MLRRLLPFLILLVLADDARASCIYPEPRRQLRTADAAFTGRFESERGDGMGKRWLTFRVETVLKGTLGETVEVYEAGVSSISLPRFTPGERVGLMLTRSGDTWTSQCQQADPDELIDATKPIPRPPGRGAAAFLVSGAFGTVSLVALDARGRTVAYGPGRGLAAVCPGGTRFVSLGMRKLTVRRTRDLRVLERRTVPTASRAHCDRGGIVLATPSGLFRGTRRIWRGEWTGMAFRGGDAYVLRGRSLLRVDLRTGREQALAEIPLAPEHEELRTLAVSGTHVAILAPNHSVRPGEPPSRLATLDLRSKRLRVADLAGSDIDGELAWVTDTRFAFLPFRGTTQFFGRALQPQGEVPGWTVGAALGGGGAVLGIAGHRFERGTASGHSVLGRLPGSNVRGLFALGSRVEIRWSRRVPRY